MSEKQWQLVQRMCCYDPSDRLSASDVARKLEMFTEEYEIQQQERQEDFEGMEPPSWEDLEETEILAMISADSEVPTVSSLLEDIEEMCVDSSTSVGMDRSVFNRLTDVLDQLKARSDAPSGAIIQHYCAILQSFYRRLKSSKSVGSARAAQFAANRQRADKIFSLHGELDAFMNATNLSSASSVHNWRTQWESKRRQRKDEMLEKLQDLPSLFDGVSSGNAREDALAYLRFELSKYPTSYATSKLDTLTQAKQTITSLVSSKNLSWFIPAYEVEFDKFDEFSRGSFEKVYHGKWKQSWVVVKTVKLRNEEDQAAFLNEVMIWFKLFHPHVVQLFGACHIQKPFFVCEYAGKGQLDHYLKDQPKEVWQKLYEAALGLRFLHVKRIVHADLKCNNILIGNDGLAKLTDFGLSILKTTAKQEEPEAEMETDKHTVGAVRWKAPEVLRGDSATLESDVYSFAMCILEAVSGKNPWGMVIPDGARGRAQKDPESA